MDRPPVCLVQRLREEVHTNCKWGDPSHLGVFVLRRVYEPCYEPVAKKSKSQLDWISQRQASQKRDGKPTLNVMSNEPCCEPSAKKSKSKLD